MTRGRRHPRSSRPRCARRHDVPAAAKRHERDGPPRHRASGSNAARRTSADPRTVRWSPPRATVQKRGEGRRVDVIGEDPPQSLRTTHLTTSDRCFGRRSAPHLRNVSSNLAGSEVVEERVHHRRRGDAQGCRPSGEVRVPVVAEPQGVHRLVGFVGCVRDDTDRLHHSNIRRANESIRPVLLLQAAPCGRSQSRDDRTPRNSSHDT